jgi:hypothetical protein
MIKAYVGDFGSGKTLSMVWDLMQRMKDGRKVVTNTPIKFYHKGLFDKKGKYYEAKFIPDGEEFLWSISHSEDCIIAIDEAAVYLPNMYWNKLPPALIVKFAQNRKYSTDIWYTTQGFGQAVKRLRELTHFVMLCHSERVLWIPDIRFKLFGKKFYKRMWKLFVNRKFLPGFFHGEPTPKKWDRYYKGSRILYPSQVKRVFRAYDTLYVVDTSAMMKVSGFVQPKKLSEEQIEIAKIQNEVAVPSVQEEETKNIINVESNELVDGEYHKLVVPQSQPVGNARIAN